MTTNSPNQRRLTEVEGLIARLDEVDMEAHLHKMREKTDELSLKIRGHYKEALRKVDELKISGVYLDERERLMMLHEAEDALHMKKFKADYPDFEEMLNTKPKRAHLDAIQNFLDGLDSPDAQQAAKFEAIFEKVKDKYFSEVMAFLMPLEKAKRAKGRQGLSPPWREVAPQLEEMRMAIAGGTKLRDAARQVLASTKTSAVPENRIQYLERLYRQKVALRE